MVDKENIFYKRSLENFVKKKIQFFSNFSFLQIYLLRGALGSYLIQVGFAFFSFINAIVYARLLGVSEYGAYANASAWIIVSSVVSTFGFGTLLVRSVATFLSEKNYGKLHGIISFSNVFVLIFSLLLISGSILFSKVVGFADKGNITYQALFWLLPLIPISALQTINGSIIRGYEHVIKARLPDMIVRPGLIFCLIILIYMIFPHRINLFTACLTNLIASTFSLLLTYYWLKDLTPKNVVIAKIIFESKPWLKSAFIMSIYGSIQSIFSQTSLLILGSLGSSEDVGVYSIVSKLAYLLMFALVATEMMLAPVIARLNAHKSDKAEIQALLTKIVRIAFISILPVGAIYFFGGKVILRTFFGVEYASGYIPLIILVTGQLINAASGSGVVVLFMLGHESIVSSVYLMVTISSLLLNYLLIPKYGINGAAIVSFVSLLLVNAILCIFTVKKEGLHITILGTMLKFC